MTSSAHAKVKISWSLYNRSKRGSMKIFHRKGDSTAPWGVERVSFLEAVPPPIGDRNKTVGEVAVYNVDVCCGKTLVDQIVNDGWVPGHVKG